MKETSQTHQEHSHSSGQAYWMFALNMLVSLVVMYRNSHLNIALYLVFAALTIGSLWATRTQALINDRQFIQSMVPHHSGAILMCREAKLQDPD